MTSLLDKLIKPDDYFQDLLHIDFAALAEQGCKLVLLDIDNTLAAHGSSAADDFAREAIERIRSAGLASVIISNARKSRAKIFAASIGLQAMAGIAKPLPGALRKACRQFGLEPAQAAMIGDQLLTDVMAARLAGCRAILVNPRHQSEAWNVKLKRRIERRLLRRYKLH